MAVAQSIIGAMGGRSFVSFNAETRKQTGRSSVGGLVALVPAAFAAIFVGDVSEAKRRFEEIAAIAARTGDRELAAHAASAAESV